MGEGKKISTFPEGISPKVNAIARVKFELAYSDDEEQHAN